MKPPTAGPSVGASIASKPATKVARLRPSPSNIRKTAEKTNGIKAPPQKPCSTRAGISDQKLFDAAQARLGPVKRPMLARNAPRVDITRVSQPVSGIATISAIRYAVCTQLNWSSAMPSPAWISGSELATIWMSRIAINMPMLMAVNPTHLLARAVPSDLGSKATSEIFAPRLLHSAARRQNALLDANASSEQRQIERRECRRDRNSAESERQHGDLSGDQQIIRVPQIPERTGSHERRGRQTDDARRPVTAQAHDHPYPAQLEQGE